MKVEGGGGVCGGAGLGLLGYWCFVFFSSARTSVANSTEQIEKNSGRLQLARQLALG